MSKVFDIGPLLSGAEHNGPEPSLSKLVLDYYLSEVPEVEAQELTKQYFAALPKHNGYDRKDNIQLVSKLLAGNIRLGAYRVRDVETQEWSDIQFHLTYDNMVMGVMGEQAAKLFAHFVNNTLTSTT